MLTRTSVITFVVIGLFCLSSYGDFPQLHRALPGANGKPGYRVTSVSHGSKVVDDNTIQNQHGLGTDTDKQPYSEHHQKSMDFESQWSQAAFYSIISCILVGLSGIFPLIIIPLEAGPSLKHGAGSAMLKLLLSFAVGSLLGDVFLHLLPEAWATIGSSPDPHWAHTVVGLWVICGMLCFMTIEKVFGEAEGDDEEEEVQQSEIKVSEFSKKEMNGNTPHMANGNDYNLRPRHNGTHQQKEHQNGSANGGITQNGHTPTAAGDNIAHEQIHNTSAKNKNIHITGYLNLLANCIDNFTHGLAVAGSYLISPKVGLCTTIAILLHEIPHEIGDFAILLRSGFDRWKAAKAQVLTASGGLLGALTALMSESAEKAGDTTAAILPFTAGGFIYIALVTVVPELLKEKCPKESLKQMACIVLGVLSMVVVTFLFEG